MSLPTRRALVTSLLVSSFALVGAVMTAPTAGAATTAVPAASCTVTPSPDGTSVTISGEGFTPPRKLNDGESTQDLNVDASGHFLLKRFQKNAAYTVLAVREDQPFVFVNCKVVKSGTGTGTTTPTPPGNDQSERGDRGERNKGRTDGRQAGLAAAAKNCDNSPVAKKDQSHGNAYWQAWQQAADRAFDNACNKG
ncbi:hypothetical protein EES37_35775 [Streptomyces sp. ADI91-18]|uniref:hypothetical protein n=1 Tax=Streptomyces sp. ADI91-18 TaxID=1522755 RepID=UPI000F54CAD3|nr:hypothetical protein [Streptomyces sp. ADI91-18]RPK28972.1 hypothetical protein EES37_35775 [Streptomyces sp. ADI91-18]